MRPISTIPTAPVALPTRRLTIKINEAADLTGLSHQTIRRAIARGDIRVNRKTRHVLIPMDELERFIAA
jgi:excisionase family DNA binding protein